MPGTDSERKDEVSPAAGLPRISMLAVRDQMTDLVDAAMRNEPTVVTRYGRDCAVLVGVKEYERLRSIEKEYDRLRALSAA